ncbi:leucine-rich repeat-containing protein 51-like isoform X2 [Coccinella septempunctata]|uniref:leucine-rich repeat-containing protein 51-like isoform X2 n=1 Tax=Coccinella septempunctata TaxID=41139 RepID=UPI001D07F4BD|nr:leucine-rich repeat-containing protein 51-like isoform X2 [Coccinella septempunctata]
MGLEDSESLSNLYVEDRRLLLCSMPADYSFQHLKILKAMGVEAARSLRTGSVPERGTAKKKLLTRSIWLNNNKLKSIKNLEVIVESILEVPSQLSWIDFSFNYIKDIDDCILKYPNLKIIYFHGNCISRLAEVMKLRKLKHLRTVTFHGNPISNIPLYRVSIMHMLPQVLNLDFFPIIKNEKLTPPPTETLKIIREYEAKEKGSSK